MLHRDQNNPELSELATPGKAKPQILEQVLAYHALGWSTVPLNGKKPAVRWAPYQSKAPSTAELMHWFGGERPRFQNVGIITTELVVVDCDSPEAANHWRQVAGTNAPAVKTGRGGVHYYYQQPTSSTIGNRAKLGGLALDIRGRGGYVVAPPSHANGNAYAWITGAPTALDDIPVFRPELLGHFRNEPARTSSSSIRDGGAYIRCIRAVSGGGGHNATFRAACKLRDAGLTPEEALAELLVWNETNAVPPWTVRELLHKVQSAFNQQRN